MRKYMLTLGALFVACVGASFLGLNLLGAALFSVPVAVQLVHRRVDRVMGLIGCAALAGLVSAASFEGAVSYALVAAVGCPLGIGILRKWTYGWTAAAITAWAYTVILGHMLVMWDTWAAEMQAMYTTWTAQLQQQIASGENGNAEAMLTYITWLQDHWQEIGFGLWMWPVLIGACIVVTVVPRRIQRLYGIEGLRGSFRAMRTSEWLVWAAIVVAGLCLFDYRWPGVVQRAVVWNAAFALASVYWMNGVSICVYAVDAFRPSPLLYVPVMVLLVWLGMQPVLCFVGLFDTWSNFRAIVDKVVAARKQREQSNGEE